MDTLEQEPPASPVSETLTTDTLFPHPEILAAEAVLRQYEQADCPLTHRFTKGMYIRRIFMPEGTLVASKVHKTQHPFAILHGRVSVRDRDTWVELGAGHIGITEPGTHRLLYIHEDTVWVTFHPNPTDETDLEKLEAMIIEPHETPRLDEGSLPLPPP
jgi:hypothetical protein